MYKKYIQLFTLLTLLNVNFAQNNTLGFGMEFNSFARTFLSNYPETNNSGFFYMPLSTSNMLIEPQFRFYSSTEKVSYNDDEYESNEYEYNENSISMLIGVYRVVTYKSVRVYGGIKVGVESTKWEFDYDDYDRFEEDGEGEASYFVIAPTLGGEYFINEHFSIGGECSLKRSTGDIELNDGDNSYYDNDYYINHNTGDKEVTKTQIEPTIILRFYP